MDLWSINLQGGSGGGAIFAKRRVIASNCEDSGVWSSTLRVSGPALSRRSVDSIRHRSVGVAAKGKKSGRENPAGKISALLSFSIEFPLFHISWTILCMLL